MTIRTAAFDDRVSFRVAEAVLGTVCRRCERFHDEASAWESFISWRGEEEAEYLRRVSAGGKYIFYSLLQDLYDFADDACHGSVAEEAGRHLTEELLVRHMPDVLQTTGVRTGPLVEQILWLVEQFLAGMTGRMYELVVEPQTCDDVLTISVVYRSEREVLEYLERTGHNVHRAFANSAGVIGGALESLLGRAIYSFDSSRLERELRDLRVTFTLHISPENRFHYEEFINILLDYAGRLKQWANKVTEPADSEASLCVSAAMKAVWEKVCKASRSDETVLLYGESGTGKSYYAGVIHKMSKRRDGPLVEVGLTSDVGSDNLIQSNLFGHVRGAFTGAAEDKYGLFALADGGTIFLDEIGDASLELQAKLLRVLDTKSFKMLGGLEDRKVDVRIIAATNRDLARLVREGSFREDLYYRLNVIQVELPPLRERLEDIPALVSRLFEKVCRDAGVKGKSLSDEALGLLCGFDWPGNIRQMENALRYAVAFADGTQINPEDMPKPMQETPAIRKKETEKPAVTGSAVVDSEALRRVLDTVPPAPNTRSFDWPGHVDHARREYMRVLIEHCKGNLGEIARHWDRSSERTLLKLIREFELEADLQAARKRH